MGIFDFKNKKEEEKKVSDKKDDKVSVAKKTEDKKGSKTAPKKETKSNQVANTSTSSSSVQGKDVKSVAGNHYRTLVKPLITEKASVLGAQNKYVFEVAKDTNKIEIAKAINYVYGVKPISVNIINTKGKKVRSGRTIGKRKDWKKAIITLPEGKTIKVYEGV